MLNRRCRQLQIESLEHRRVLNVDPVVIDVDLILRRDSSQQITADFNGDGVTDVLEIPASQNNWTIRINDGTQRFQFSVGERLADAKYLGTGDFNGDSLLDVISFDDTTGDLWVSLNRQTSFEHQRWGNFTPTTTWTQLFVGDFNNDGLTDLLGGEAKGHWWLAKNYQGETFQHFHWGRFQDFDWVDVLDGDFTGDGLTDIVARAPDNSWWLWENGDAGFELARYFGHWKMRDQWTDVEIADFNGDATDDIIGRTEDGRLWVGSATNDGFHTWTWGDGWAEAANWSNVSVLDLNGDQLPDQIGRTDTGLWAFALNVGGKFQNHHWQTTNPALNMTVVPDYSTADAVDIVEAFGFESDSELGSGLDTAARNSHHFSVFANGDQNGGGNESETPTRGDGTTTEAEPLRATLTQDNRIELTPPFPMSLLGVSISSASGSLVPVGGDQQNDGFTIPTVSPFQFLLSNRESEITYGNIGFGVFFSESLQLDARWVPSDPSIEFHSDVTILYGREADTGIWLAELGE